MRRAAHWLLIAALSLSIGLQWTLVQSVAWVGMIVSFSRDNSIPRSVAMTFDGEHQCDFCRAVQKAGHEEGRKELQKLVKAPDLAEPEHDRPVFIPGAELLAIASTVVAPDAPAVRPLLPPPKVA